MSARSHNVAVKLFQRTCDHCLLLRQPLQRSNDAREAGRAAQNKAWHEPTMISHTVSLQVSPISLMVTIHAQAAGPCEGAPAIRCMLRDLT